jgi:hypothetical protein
MQIFVPTRGRIEKQITRDRWFIDDFNGTFVVPQHEYDSYWKHEDVQTLVVPSEWGIAKIRQHILEQNPVGMHVVLDDDLYAYRRTGEGTKLRTATQEDVSACFAWCRDLCEEQGVVHGGVSAREGNNRTEEPMQACSRCTRFHFYDAEVLIREGIRFDAVQLMEDFHVTLSLLERGFNNVVIYEFAHNQPASASKGGCDHYRTPELQAESAHLLAALHPTVKVVEKWTKSSWGGGYRTDVRVGWVKAFNHGKVK